MLNVRDATTKQILENQVVYLSSLVARLELY